MPAEFSARMAGVIEEGQLPQVPGLRRAGGWLMRQNGVPARFALGAVTALLPCGLVWAALGLAVGSAHTGGGAVVMVAFGMGTSFRSALAHGGRVDVVELVPEVFDAFDYFHADAESIRSAILSGASSPLF